MTSHPFLSSVRTADLVRRSGRVTKIMPTFIETDGPDLSPGAICIIQRSAGGDDDTGFLGQAVCAGEDFVRVAPLEAGSQTAVGAQVLAMPGGRRVPVGDDFAGRMVDGLGRPADGGLPITPQAWRELDGAGPGPLQRHSPRHILETGIKAIDTMTTLDRGQRVGVFAAAGVGKTSLVTQLANQTEADRIVVCLIGERGREVEALWSGGLSAERKATTVLVASTSDQPAAMRVRAASFAAALAEHWRDQGLHVVFLLDSVTRLAMALREVGLAAGEPPTIRAYTPGVFAAVPKLVERFGAVRDAGAITAIMTVLCETDDADDPIAEMMKSLLDGHIVLSRNLAERGHFPAIDVPRSLSRLAPGVRAPAHAEACQKAVRVLATLEDSKTLVESGLYTAGASAEIDQALRLRPGLMEFLRQRSDQAVRLADAVADLAKAVREDAAP